jgi:hypothetical protein
MFLPTYFGFRRRLFRSTAYERDRRRCDSGPLFHDAAGNRAHRLFCLLEAGVPTLSSRSSRTIRPGARFNDGASHSTTPLGRKSQLTPEWWASDEVIDPQSLFSKNGALTLIIVSELCSSTAADRIRARDPGLPVLPPIAVKSPQSTASGRRPLTPEAGHRRCPDLAE